MTDSANVYAGVFARSAEWEKVDRWAPMVLAVFVHGAVIPVQWDPLPLARSPGLSARRPMRRDIPIAASTPR